jgi:hypothetical protein
MHIGRAPQVRKHPSTSTLSWLLSEQSPLLFPFAEHFNELSFAIGFVSTVDVEL